MTVKEKKLLIGAHMSTSGGLYTAFARGTQVGCTTMQIFTKSNRQWNTKPLLQKDIDLFIQTAQQSHIAPIVVHASYLINLGSPNLETVQKSIEALAIELTRCQDLAIPYLILHPGSHVKTDEDICLNTIADNLNTVFNQVPGNTTILLETMAGQGSSVCYKFEHIAQIINQSQYKNRLGVCLDTCHVFAAGYDISTVKGYEQLWTQFDTIIGLKKLKLIHVNDSKKECGSRVDRHEDIGKGKIGLQFFKLLFNDERFFDIPKILETPKDNLEDDIKNITTIKKLIMPKTKLLINI